MTRNTNERRTFTTAYDHQLHNAQRHLLMLEQNVRCQQASFVTLKCCYSIKNSLTKSKLNNSTKLATQLLYQISVENNKTPKNK